MWLAPTVLISFHNVNLIVQRIEIVPEQARFLPRSHVHLNGIPLGTLFWVKVSPSMLTRGERLPQPLAAARKVSPKFGNRAAKLLLQRVKLAADAPLRIIVLGMWVGAVGVRVPRRVLVVKNWLAHHKRHLVAVV